MTPTNCLGGWLIYIVQHPGLVWTCHEDVASQSQNAHTITGMMAFMAPTVEPWPNPNPIETPKNWGCSCRKSNPTIFRCQLLLVSGRSGRLQSVLPNKKQTQTVCEHVQTGELAGSKLSHGVCICKLTMRHLPYRIYRLQSIMQILMTWMLYNWTSSVSRVLQFIASPPQEKVKQISKHLFDKGHIFQILEIHNGRCQTNKRKKQNEDLGVSEFLQGLEIRRGSLLHH